MAISPEGGVHLGRNYNPCDEIGAHCSLWVIVNHDAPNRLPLSTPGLLKQQVTLTKNAADSFGCGNIADSESSSSTLRRCRSKSATRTQGMSSPSCFASSPQMPFLQVV